MKNENGSSLEKKAEDIVKKYKKGLRFWVIDKDNTVFLCSKRVFSLLKTAEKISEKEARIFIGTAGNNTWLTELFRAIEKQKKQ